VLNEVNSALSDANGSDIQALGPAYPERRPPSSVQTVWKWVLRLCLPLLIGVSIKALDWLWVDNIYGTRWLDVVGGTALALGLASIALWCVCVWLVDGDDPGEP
jgi:hypothetical protein